MAAYRCLDRLVARAADRLRREGPDALPPCLVVYAPDDEFVHPAPLQRLARQAPQRVTLRPLDAAPRRPRPRHLCIDAASLGEAPWRQLCGDVTRWLSAQEAAAAGGPAAGAPA